jgi:hypothetical protein
MVAAPCVRSTRLPGVVLHLPERGLAASFGWMNDARAPIVGVCHACRFRRVITSRRGSTFLLCRRSDFDPAFAKYPHLPVLQCEGFEPSPDEDSDP